jgi:hypothetical protein
MTTADDRHDQDVWAQAVAEAAAAKASVPKPVSEPTPGAASEPTPAPASEPVPTVKTEARPRPGAKPESRVESQSDLFGPELAPLVDEVRRFASSLGEKVTAVSSSVNSGDSLGALQNLAAPLRSKHPEVYGHLIAAGGELLAAYRSAVAASERRWTAEKPASSEQIDLD